MILTTLSRAAFFMALFLYAASAFAADGTCPSDASYLNSSGTTLVTLASLGVTNCYYIAADGSDSNDGLSESSPWAHSPGMSTCTENCAAVIPAAGQGFIFRGGDTWNGSNLGITWKWSGTPTNPIYIGVDKTWYSGSSWTRPIWTCGGVNCTGGTIAWYFASGNSYIIVDNFEATGFYVNQTGNPGAYVFGACGQNQTYENMYVHGWSTDPNPQGTYGTVFHGCNGNSIKGTVMRYNVIDGQDTTQNMMTAMYPSIPTAYGNYIRYVITGIDGTGDNWHDNVVEYLVVSPVFGHQDGYYHTAQAYSPNTLLYNNLIRHVTFTGANGAVKFWMNGNGPCPFSSCTSYAFNNIIYDTYPGNTVDTGGHFGVNYGTWYIFNNTFDCGTDKAPGGCSVGDGGNGQHGVGLHGQMTLYLINNHWISTEKTSIIGFGGRFGRCAWFICSEINGLYQSNGAAKKRGYTSGSAYAFQPTNSNGSTVGKGANQDSLCAAVNAIDANAGAACKSGTTYACAYNATNHTVSCPAIVPVTRPTTAWDVGAYQFSFPQPSKE
jgi:hypothetical protein